MREKKATIRQPRKRANVEARGKGRVDGATQLATIDLRAQAVELYLSGLEVPEIAKRMGKSEISVYGYISYARTELIKSKKEHFDARLTLQMDDAMDAIAVNGSLLADKEWLQTAAPERISEVSKAYGILSDKCFILLAAAQRLRGGAVVPRQEAPEPVCS